MNLCNIKSISIMIIIVIISIVLYDYLILRKRENFTIDEEGAKKLGIYDAIRILKDIEDKETLNVKNLNVTEKANIKGDMDANKINSNQIKSKNMNIMNNANIKGNMDVSNKVQGKYFKLNGGQISNNEAKGDGCFYRNSGQVHIGCDDWIYFRDNNRNSRIRFGVHENMIYDNRGRQFIKHNDKVLLTVKGTGNHEGYGSNKYLGFCGWGSCDKINAGLNTKERGRLRILRY